MKLTDEQKTIIESSGNIKVHAVAGSGKTSTLVHYSTKRRNKNILYLAFNRSVKAEAIRRFKLEGLTNVKIDTAHSLAWRSIVAGGSAEVRHGYKSSEIAKHLNLSTTGKNSLSGLILAYHISCLTSFFCNSAVQKVQELDYSSIVHDASSKSFVQNHLDQIVHGTRMLLAKMNSGDIPLTHDFYLKKFQLSKPVLGFDYILFDEGQDASPVMLDIFKNQESSINVIVGDIHQQIYSWRHAVNALSDVDFKNFFLTTSFRFPQNIADLAMNCLQWKQQFSEYTPIKITGAGKPCKTKSKATLARTNIALLKCAIDFTNSKSGSGIYFEGNFSSYTASENGSLYDVLSLYKNATGYIKNPEIAAMKTFDTLQEYAEMTGDKELLMLINLVEQYGNQLPYALKKIRDSHVEDDHRDRASMIFSTVHKCKGLEYDSITLADDFIDEKKVAKLSEKKNLSAVELEKINEEINLRYVAITRTRNKILFTEDSPVSNNSRSGSKINTKKSNELSDFNKSAGSYIKHKKVTVKKKCKKQNANRSSGAGKFNYWK